MESENLYPSYSSFPLINVVNQKKNSAVSKSYGLIVKCSTTNRCIYVKRKHSYSLILFLWGNYTPVALVEYISNIYKNERSIVRSCIANYISYIEIADAIVPGTQKYVKDYAYSRIVENRELILDLLDFMPVKKINRWCWPKGKKEKNETDLETAKREFLEEVGFNIESVEYTINTTPIKCECSTNYKKIIDTFWTINVENEFEVKLVDNNEVANVKWACLEEIKDKIDYRYLEIINNQP